MHSKITVTQHCISFRNAFVKIITSEKGFQLYKVAVNLSFFSFFSVFISGMAATITHKGKGAEIADISL